MALHVLASVVWVGGMFFAFACMRPTLNLLDPQLRLRMWAGSLSRFFRFVWVSIALLLVTGIWMVFGHFHGIQHVGTSVHLMLGLGLVMMLLAAHVYFAPYKRLKRLISRSNWSEAAHQMNQIRWLIGLNLMFGLVVFAVASSGRYWPHP